MFLLKVKENFRVVQYVFVIRTLLLLNVKYLRHAQKPDIFTLLKITGEESLKAVEYEKRSQIQLKATCLCFSRSHGKPNISFKPFAKICLASVADGVDHSKYNVLSSAENLA